MLTAKKLPSGNWNVKVYAGKDEIGKRIYKSFTEPAERKALMVAMEWQEHHKEITRDNSKMSLSEAMDGYIDECRNILSPSTIFGYIKIKKYHFINLQKLKLSSLTQQKIQAEISIEAKKYSPKTISNAHGFLSSVLKRYRPDFVLNTKLPAKVKFISQIPTGEQIGLILNEAIGTDNELPILLAVWLGLRVSEVRAITWDKIVDGKLIINRAIVEGEDGATEKSTKSYEGTRELTIPPYIMSVIERYDKSGEYIIAVPGRRIYKRFVKLCERLKLPHFRFHDLRHTNASVMLRLNVPDKYAKERGGWGSDIYKTVYQHTMDDMSKSVDDSINNYFNSLLQHEMQHSDKKD